VREAQKGGGKETRSRASGEQENSGPHIQMEVRRGRYDLEQTLEVNSIEREESPVP